MVGAPSGSGGRRDRRPAREAVSKPGSTSVVAALPVSDTAAIFGLWGQTSAFGFLFGLPVIVFELSVGVYLTVRGFRPAGLAALSRPPHAAVTVA